MTPRDPRYSVEFYEGLVRKTAARYAPYVEDDYEDVVQILRVKCWRALSAFNPERSRMNVERYVFMCMTNQVKDLLKRKRRNELYIEDQGRMDDDVQAGDQFNARYLAAGHDETFRDVEAERPLIPSTLTVLERKVLALLYDGYTHREVALRLSITKATVETAVERIQAKMADWRPAAAAEDRVAA